MQILEQKGSPSICGLHRTWRIKKILFNVHTHTHEQDWASFNLQALKIVKNIFFSPPSGGLGLPKQAENKG